MACLGGCIGGPCNINHELKDKFDIDKFSKAATKTCILETLAELENEGK
jgi:iron only hydrogenase large subunit-like protein